MNMEKYRHAWAAQREKHSESFRLELERMAAKLDRSYRRERAILATCSLNTGIATALLIWVLFRQVSLNWSEVFPMVAIQIAGIAGLVILVRRHLQRRRAREWSAAPVREAARRALMDLQGEVRNMKLLLAAGLVIIPLLAIAVSQLYSSGKMNEQAVSGFGMLCTVVIAINALVMTTNYRRRLRPQRKRLKQILEAFEQDMQAS
jgi:hypothetical protein